LTWLNPIQQKLFLYSFSMVEVHPFIPSLNGLWKLPGLQSLFEGRHAANWQKLFPQTHAYSAVTQAPLVSNNLSALKRIRKRQPHRGLIFVRTAFEPELDPNRLKPLIGVRKAAAGLLHKSDPFQPLYLLADGERLQPEWITSYGGRHPRAEMLERARVQNPKSLFRVVENGSISEQPWLFSSRKHWSPDSELKEEARRFDEALRCELQEIEGGAFLVASDPELLTWFHCDCIRLLSKRYCYWNFPDMPDPRDGMIHFVLVADQSLKFTNPDNRFRTYYLDGTQRQHSFREVRFRPGKNLGWRHMGNAVAGARKMYGKTGLSFYRNEQGWFSGDGPVRVPNHSAEFMEREQLLSDLGVL